MFEVQTINTVTNRIEVTRDLYYQEHAIAYAKALEQDYLRDPVLEVKVVNKDTKEVVDY